MECFEREMFNIILNWLKLVYYDYRIETSILYNLIMISGIRVSLRANKTLLIYVKGNLVSELQYSSPSLFGDISEIIKNEIENNA